MTVYQFASVLPGSSDLKTGVVEQASNALARELITVLGVNRFASREVKIKFRMLDTYILLLRTLEVHLDPRLHGIPKRAMAEASGVEVASQFSIRRALSRLRCQPRRGSASCLGVRWGRGFLPEKSAIHYGWHLPVARIKAPSSPHSKDHSLGSRRRFVTSSGLYVATEFFERARYAD